MIEPSGPHPTKALTWDVALRSTGQYCTRGAREDFYAPYTRAVCGQRPHSLVLYYGLGGDT